MKKKAVYLIIPAVLCVLLAGCGDKTKEEEPAAYPPSARRKNSLPRRKS